MKKFEGVFPALPVPFTKGGAAFDESALRQMIDDLIDKGVHGLFATGSTGEGPSIPPEERKRIIDVVVDQTAGRAQIIIQACYNLLPETIDIATYAAKVGVDAIATLAPWYYHCDRLAMTQYMSAIAEALGSTPLFLYNIPDRTTNDFPFEVVADLKEKYENIRGIKESGNLTNLSRWMQLQDERFRVYCGMDQHEYDAYRLGGRALVASFANWLPETFVAFHNAACAGNWEEAWKHQQTIIRTITPAVNENVLANIKFGLREKGIPAGYVRPPLRDLTVEEENDLREN